MTDTAQPILTNRELLYARIMVILNILVLVVSLILFAVSLFEDDIQEWPFGICYVIIVVLLVIDLRTKRGFTALTAKRIRGSLIVPYFLILFYLVLSAAISKHAFNKMGLLNNYIIGCTLVFGLLGSFAIIYKNQSLKLPAYSSRLYRYAIIATAIVTGYGFSLLLNCCGIAESSVIYTLPIENSFVQSAKGKNGIYYIKHFKIPVWPYTHAFGNDIVIPPRLFDKYPNIEDIKKGDEVSIQVHRGLLHLDWIEPLYFVQTPENIQ